MDLENVGRQIECERTKKGEKRETKTPSTKEQCRRNPMQSIEEVEVKKRDSMAFG